MRQKFTRTLSLFSALALALVFSFLPVIIPAVFAASGALELTVGTVLAEPGETVTIPVTVTNNPGIASFGFKLVYDEELMTLQSIEKTAGILSLTGSFESNTGTGLIAWASADDVTTTGVLFNLTFTINSDCIRGSESVIKLELKSGFGEDLTNAAGKHVALKAAQGRVMTRPAVFANNTWSIPAVSSGVCVLSLDGWTIEQIIYNDEEPESITTSGNTITVDNNRNVAFNAVAKIVDNDETIRYIGIEKPISVSAGTMYNGKTWTVPKIAAADASLTVSDIWTIESVTGAGSGVECTDSTITVSGAAGQNLIAKLVNSGGKMMYIGIDIG